MKKMWAKGIAILIVVFLFLFWTLFLIRMFSVKYLDDVTPGISCKEELLKKADIYFVIPNFENHSISKDNKWCNEILKRNKTLELHGVYHTYEEFLVERDEGYLQIGINEFEECFGFLPEGFKAPQLAISRNNEELIEEFGMKRYGKFEQVLHKTYHCEDTGFFPNWVIDLY